MYFNAAHRVSPIRLALSVRCSEVLFPQTLCTGLTPSPARCDGISKVLVFIIAFIDMNLKSPSKICVDFTAGSGKCQFRTFYQINALTNFSNGQTDKIFAPSKFFVALGRLGWYFWNEPPFRGKTFFWFNAKKCLTNGWGWFMMQTINQNRWWRVSSFLFVLQRVAVCWKAIFG